MNHQNRRRDVSILLLAKNISDILFLSVNSRDHETVYGYKFTPRKSARCTNGASTSVMLPDLCSPQCIDSSSNKIEFGCEKLANKFGLDKIRQEMGHVRHSLNRVVLKWIDVISWEPLCYPWSLSIFLLRPFLSRALKSEEVTKILE
jgi:hypothetical protein